MGDVVVLEFLALLKGAYQDRVVLWGDEGDCVETEWWWHFKQDATLGSGPIVNGANATSTLSLDKLYAN